VARRVSSLTVAILLLTVRIGLFPWRVEGQSAASVQAAGSTAHRLGTGALGALSGAAWGSIGSFFPCSRAAEARSCTAVSIISASAVAGTAGVLLGADSSAAEAVLRRAAWGGLASGALGLGLSFTGVGAIQTWYDGLALGVLGAAFVATLDDVWSPTLIGLAVGAGVQGVRVLTSEDMGLAAVIEGAAIGTSVGALVWWLIRGVEAQSEDDPVVMAVSLRIGE